MTRAPERPRRRRGSSSKRKTHGGAVGSQGNRDRSEIPMSQDHPLVAHTIVAGYGLPGRAIVDVLHSRGIAHCVIELNPQTVQRCSKIGTPIIAGNCADPEVLQRAGIASATSFVIAIP